jgi:hypothetical protein
MGKLHPTFISLFVKVDNACCYYDLHLLCMMAPHVISILVISLLYGYSSPIFVFPALLFFFC